MDVALAYIALQEIGPARDFEPQRLACLEPRGAGRQIPCRHTFGLRGKQCKFSRGRARCSPAPTRVNFTSSRLRGYIPSLECEELS